MRHLLLNIDWTFFDKMFLGEKISNYIWCISIIVVTMLLKKPVAGLLTRLSSLLAAKYSYMQHKDTIRNMVFKPMERLLQTVLYYVAINQLNNLLDNFVIHHTIGNKNKVNIRVDDIIDHVFLFLFIIFLTQVITRLMDFVYYLRMGKAQQENNQSRQQLLPLIKEMAKLVTWALSVFWILGSVFHVNIPALITGLGIGGVAIALAGKETVENFFAAFTILSDKPFKVGDTIKLGDMEGVIERIGFRSTRMRSTDGSAYIIPNQSLVSQSLVNMTTRDTRGVKVTANIKYGLTHEALQAMIAELKETILNTSPAQDPVEVSIESFDKETLQLVVSYHLPHPLPDDAKLATLKREINLKVFDIISRHASLGAPPSSSSDSK